MPIHFERPPARVFINSIAVDVKVERTSTLVAEVQSPDWKSLDESLRLSARRKPRGPYLDGHPTLISRATIAPRIHQQIAEPPGATPVGKAEAKKPDLVTAASRKGRIDFVECLQTLAFEEIILQLRRRQDWRE